VAPRPGLDHFGHGLLPLALEDGDHGPPAGASSVLPWSPLSWAEELILRCWTIARSVRWTLFWFKRLVLRPARNQAVLFPV